jgi:putative endonuclease
MSEKQTIGARGEQLASEYLQQHGYLIRTRNWHCQAGEIDIIAEDKQVLVFIEVKTRRTVSTEYAFMNITQQKRRKMIAAAQEYLTIHNLSESEWRIDAVAVTIRKDEPPLIDHVEDVLDW